MYLVFQNVERLIQLFVSFGIFLVFNFVVRLDAFLVDDLLAR